MTDPTQAEGKSKTPGLLRRVLWWLWVGMLCVVLAGAVFFAAAWKVITLIATFLAAATILPRRHRKWFWLGAGVVTLAAVVWVFLPEDNKSWRPYTFDKELAELQAKYAVPDAENAAIIYKQILADWKQKEANEPNLPERWFDLVKHGSWLSKDQPEIAAYLWYHRNTIEGVLQATSFEKCSFPIVATLADFGKDMGRLPPTQQWVYLLIAAGNNALAEGGANEAIEKYLAVLRMGQHMCWQHSNLDMLVGIACEALGLGGINNFVVWGDASELYLSKVEQAVSETKHDLSSDLPGFIEIEKLMLKNMLGELFYEVNSKGKVRFSQDPLARIRDQTREQFGGVTVDDAEIFSGYWFKKLFKAYTILYWFYVPATPEKLSQIVNASFEKHYAMTKPDFDWSRQPQNMPIETLFQFKMNFRQQADLLARMDMEMYFRLNDIYLRNSAQQRGTLLIIALRRYKNTNGRWPEKLEDIKDSVPAEILIDPTNDDSFVYKRTDDNFTLYSKGQNGIDDGGKRDIDTEDKGGPDDILIWRPKSPEDKKESGYEK